MLQENITAAIAAKIRMPNERGSKTALPDETLQFIVPDCAVRWLTRFMDCSWIKWRRKCLGALVGVFWFTDPETCGNTMQTHDMRKKQSVARLLKSFMSCHMILSLQCTMRITSI